MIVQPMLVEHVFRSVRGWLHGIKPTASDGSPVYIYLDRKQEEADAARPAFRMELTNGPVWKEAAPGMSWTEMTVTIHYAAEDLMDAQRMADAMQAYGTPPANRMPLRLYNFAWPALPHVDVVATSGGAFPSAVDLAIVARDADGNASAPSARIPITVPAGRTIRVTPQGWPYDGFAASWRLYGAASGGVLKLQAEWNDGDTPPVIDGLVIGANVPTQAMLPFKGLRVASLESQVAEGAENESLWYSVTNLRLRCQVPRIMRDAQIDAALQ